MDEELELTCPYCERRFYVVWSNDGLGPPEYFPMCGGEMSYRAAAEKARGDDEWSE